VLDNQKLAAPGAAVVITDSNRASLAPPRPVRTECSKSPVFSRASTRLKRQSPGLHTHPIDLRLEVNQRLRLTSCSNLAEWPRTWVHQTAPLLDTVSSSVGQVIGEGRSRSFRSTADSS
jgi:hypothetical protein